MSMCFFKFSNCLLYLIFLINTVENSKNEVYKINMRIGDTNDTILEFYQNCTCTAFFGCGYRVLEHMEAGQAGRVPVVCSDEKYWCCKNVDESFIPESTETVTVPSGTTSTTTEKAANKAVSIQSACGLPTTNLNFRILNPETDSQTTIPGEMPWIVEIFEKKSQEYRYKCAGTLIHPKVVLTAQHYFRSCKEDSLKVLANSEGPFRNLTGAAGIEKNVFKIIRHPDYYSGGLYNDIALLILEEPFIYGNHMLNSICLPKPGQVFNGQKCLGVGWGENPNHWVIPLRKVDVPVVERQQCENLLRRTYLGNDFNLHKSFMCAGGEEGKDTCKGDGGGPLICLDNYRFVQAGITSWGVYPYRCGVKDQPGVYVDVAQFRDWINNELANQNIYIK